MKKLLSTVVACLMTVSLAACGSSASEGDSANTFTFASELDIKNLDSRDADDGQSFNAMHAVIDGLMGLNADGEVDYAIAEEHTVSDDGLTHTFKLREAYWSNGTQVTANDFVYAWQTIISQAGNYAYMLGSDGAHVAGADELMAKAAESELTQEDLDTLGAVAQDDTTFVVTLTSPVSYFEELMTFPCYYPINQEYAEEQGDQYAKSADTIISNGAFVMESWTQGSQATFVKNEDYWNADAVKIDGLVMNLVQEPTVAAQNFKSGENDFAPISSDLVDQYKDSENYLTFNEGYLFYLEPNHMNTDLQNVNLRKALSLAIDREDFAANVLKDGSKEADGFVPRELSISPSGSDFRDDSEDFTAYNLEEAQAALDTALQELGKDEITLELLYGTDESPMDILAEYLQSAYSKLEGLNVQLVATTKQDRIYNRMANGEFDIALTRWGPDYGDPTTYLNLMKTGNNNNYGMYSNAEYDALMDQISVETDLNTRWQLMVDAEKVAMSEYANISVFEKGLAALQNTSAKGLVHRPVGVPYTFNYVYFE